MASIGHPTDRRITALAEKIEISGDSDAFEAFENEFGISVSEALKPNTDALQPKHIKIPQGNQRHSFDMWFQDSKVVNEDGFPLVVYHGTNNDVGTFKTRKNNGRGFYFSANPEVANTYTKKDDGYGANIIPVFLSLKHPHILYGNGCHWASIPFNGQTATLDYISQCARENGHDGVIAHNIQDLSDMEVEDNYLISTTYIAFNPEQIKSATGSNEIYDPNEARITSISSSEQTRMIKRYCKDAAKRNVLSESESMLSP